MTGYFILMLVDSVFLISKPGSPDFLIKFCMLSGKIT